MTPTIFPHRIAAAQLPPQFRRGRHSLRSTNRPAESLPLSAQHTGEIAIATRRLRVPGPVLSFVIFIVLPAVLYVALMLALVGAR